MRLGRVINNSVALILLDFLNKAIPFVVFPWVVRALGPAVYGQLGYAGAVAGFFGLLASPGFTSYALREAARDPANVPFLARHVLGARMVFAVGAFLALVVFTLFFAPQDGETRLLIVLSGLAFVTGSLDTQWIFAARSRMWVIAGQGALGQLAYAGLILALVRGSRDAWIVPTAAVVSSILTASLIWLRARHEYNIPLPKFSPRAWRVFLPISLVIGFASLMSLIYDQIDTVMIKYFRTDTELGMYVASYGLMTAAMSFLPILGQVFMPLLSESAGQDAGEQTTYLRWLGRATVGLALPIAVGGFILAVPLSKFVLGNQYPNSGILLRWLMLTLLTGPLASYYGSQLIPNNRERKYLFSVGVGAIANVVLNLFLIPKYGAIAAALTTALSQGVVAFFNYWFVRDLLRPSLWASVALSVPATCLMAVSINELSMAYHLQVVLLVGVGGLLYLFLYGLSLVVWNRVSAH